MLLLFYGLPVLVNGSTHIFVSGTGCGIYTVLATHATTLIKTLCSLYRSLVIASTVLIASRHPGKREDEEEEAH